MVNRSKEVLGKVENVRENLRDGGETALSRISGPIDAGMASAMHRIGVPTRKEIQALTKRVEELTRTAERSRGRAREVAKRR